MRRIYLASSWRNPGQPEAVKRLREAGHIVYDFRNPSPDNQGFHWSEIEIRWQDWGVIQFIDALQHPIAEAGYGVDLGAMKWADTFVLLLPCGESAHLELGWAIGAGKLTFITWVDEFCDWEPELMYKLADFIRPNLDAVIRDLRVLECTEIRS